MFGIFTIHHIRYKIRGIIHGWGDWEFIHMWAAVFSPNSRSSCLLVLELLTESHGFHQQMQSLLLRNRRCSHAFRLFWADTVVKRNISAGEECVIQLTALEQAHGPWVVVVFFSCVGCVVSELLQKNLWYKYSVLVSEWWNKSCFLNILYGLTLVVIYSINKGNVSKQTDNGIVCIQRSFSWLGLEVSLVTPSLCQAQQRDGDGEQNGSSGNDLEYKLKGSALCATDRTSPLKVISFTNDETKFKFQVTRLFIQVSDHNTPPVYMTN